MREGMFCLIVVLLFMVFTIVGGTAVCKSNPAEEGCAANICNCPPPLFFCNTK